MAQLETRGQEFWTTVLQSDTVKNGIQLVSDLVNGLTDLIKTLGVLPTLSLVGGGLLSAKNIGISCMSVHKSNHCELFEYAPHIQEYIQG